MNTVSHVKVASTVVGWLLSGLLLACSSSSSDSAPGQTDGADVIASDSAAPDTAAPDTGELDSGELDTGELDTGAPDSGTPDTGIEDTGAPDSGAPDSGGMDTDGEPDVAEADTGADAGDDAADAGPAPGTSLFGTISGSCGELASHLGESGPSFLTSTYTFDAAFDAEALPPGPKKRYDIPNAGGSSKCSEVMSLQVLMDCDGAALYKTENEVVYDETGPLTDYVVQLDGQTVGVSVTRAYLGPVVMDYDVTKATDLLTKKLEGINESSANVSAADAWVKQVLHVWTLQPSWVPILETAWNGLDASLTTDTIVLVTVEAQSDVIVTDSCDE